MGVAIHYRGTLKSPQLVQELSLELADICAANGWPFELIDNSTFQNLKPMPLESDIEDDSEENQIFLTDLESGKCLDFGLRGITFQPVPSEIASFLFDTEGVMRTVLSIVFPNKDQERHPWSFIRTQAGGVDIHVKMINLLRYLRKKYFKRLEIEDDGGYYPRNRKGTLKRRMELIQQAIDTIQDIMQNGQFTGTPEEILAQVQEAVSRSIRGAEIQILKIENERLPHQLKSRLDRDES